MDGYQAQFFQATNLSTQNDFLGSFLGLAENELLHVVQEPNGVWENIEGQAVNFEPGQQEALDFNSHFNLDLHSQHTFVNPVPLQDPTQYHEVERNVQAELMKVESHDNQAAESLIQDNFRIAENESATLAENPKVPAEDDNPDMLFGLERDKNFLEETGALQLFSDIDFSAADIFNIPRAECELNDNEFPKRFAKVTNSLATSNTKILENTEQATCTATLGSRDEFSDAWFADNVYGPQIQGEKNDSHFLFPGIPTDKTDSLEISNFEYENQAEISELQLEKKLPEESLVSDTNYLCTNEPENEHAESYLQPINEISSPQNVESVTYLTQSLRTTIDDLGPEMEVFTTESDFPEKPEEGQNLPFLEEMSLNCETCNIPFSSKGELRLHNRQKHPRKKKYKCPRNGCEKMFSLKCNMNKHMSSVHLKNRPHECPECGQLFAEANKMININTAYMTRRKILCACE